MTDQGEQDVATGLAVVRAQLGALTEAVKALTVRFDTTHRENVLRTEWELRNQHVDTKFQSQGKEISELRTELRSEKSRRPSWATIVAAVVAIVVLGLDIISRYTT